MRSEGYDPPSPTTGTRYCRGRRSRRAVPRAVLTVRHSADGLVLNRERTAAVPPPAPRSWRGPLAFAAALAALTVSVTLLVTGPWVGAAAEKGPCPARTSAAAYAGGRELLVRAEPAHGGIALLHLCADPAIGPVRTWALSIDGRPVAVQPVAGSTALAAAPLPTGRHIGITVAVVPRTGLPLTFTTRMPPG
ncbi:hypothetical protein [Winogradskya humida]|uniref:Anti-sigma-K factor rskA n=1 Tax=Winogradskya humida TaxID=113566 RepID=A0ABQ4A3X7_9ACTN|nr:hypothetical protein [Actinoplanes humidus]GIE25528.1 hypothetical protein Ahu01nite_086300 [Actinoplanes humidus]